MSSVENKGEKETPKSKEELEQALSEELGKDTKILQEMGKLSDEDKVPEEDWLEKSLENIPRLDRETVARLIEGGASDEQIISVAEDLQEFVKFDGSSYYLSAQNKNKYDDAQKHKRQWRRRSAAGHRSEGEAQEKIFSELIPAELDNYRNLLKAFGGTYNLMAGIDYLERSDRDFVSDKEFFNELRSVAETGEYKQKAENKREQKEVTEEISKGDFVYYMEKEMRRWRDPKEVISIKTIGPDEYAKFEDDEALYPLSKLKKSDQIEKAETEYQPGPKDVSPSTEDLKNISRAENLAFKTFASRFGISYEELKSLEGFPQDEAKQRWLLENLTQLTTGRIQSEAERRREEALDATIPDKWKSDAGGRLGNFVNAFMIEVKKIRERTRKEHHRASFEKQILEEIQNGGIAEHGDVLRQLIETLNKADFGVGINSETDKLELTFVEVPDDATERELEVLRSYNQAADRMAHTPDDWRLDSASSSQQKEYKQVKEAYEVARAELFELRLEQDDFYDDEVAVSQYLNKKDYSVHMNQLLNTDPELEKELNSIANNKVWWRSIKKSFNSKNYTRAAVMAGGFVTRAATAAATWGAGSFIASAGFGSWRGYLEAGRKLDSKKSEARYGGIDNIDGLEELVAVRDQIIAKEEQLSSTEDKDEIRRLRQERKELLEKRDSVIERKDIRQKLYEVGALVNAADLMEKLERDIRLIEESESGSNQHESRLRSLEARVQYTLNKLDGGMVNFGSNPSDIAFTKLNLTQLLSEAQVSIETGSEEDVDEIFERWRQHIGLRDEEETERARKQFKKKEMLKAAGASASLFATGYGLRLAGEVFGWWDGPVFSGSGSTSELPGPDLPDGIDLTEQEIKEIIGTATADSSAWQEGADGGLGGKSLDEQSHGLGGTSTDSLSGSESSGLGGQQIDEGISQGGLGGIQTAEEADSLSAAPKTAVDDSTNVVTEQEKAVLGGEQNTGVEDQPLGGDQDLNPGEQSLGGEQVDAPENQPLGGEQKEGPKYQPLGGEQKGSIMDDVTSEIPPRPPALEVQEFVINEDGEGMIHAIADGLEEKYNLSHEKAMKIGNALFIKGEALQGDDEMYNLVGKGATFRLDFGDLTAADLDNMSVNELTEQIDFDNEAGFTAGESGIKGLELPGQEEVDTTASAEYDPSVDQSGRYENSPIESRDLEGTTFQDIQKEAEADLEAKRVAEEAKEAQRQAAAESTDNVSEGVSSETVSESSSETEAVAAESSEKPAPTASSIEALREGIAANDVDNYIDGLQVKIAEEVADGSYDGISVNALTQLEEYLEASPDQDIVTTIEKMSQDNPRLLLTLEKVIDSRKDVPPGSLWDQLGDLVSQSIKENKDSISESLKGEAKEIGILADTFKEVEVNEESNKEFANQIEGYAKEVNQYAENSNDPGRRARAKDRLQEIENIARTLRRVSWKVDSEDGEKIFGGIKDIADDLGDML